MTDGAENAEAGADDSGSTVGVSAVRWAVATVTLLVVAGIVMWQAPNLNRLTDWSKVASATSDGTQEIIIVVAWATLASLFVALLALLLTFRIYRITSAYADEQNERIMGRFTAVLDGLGEVAPSSGSQAEKSQAWELVQRIVPLRRQQKKQAPAQLERVDEVPLGELARLVDTWKRTNKKGQWTSRDVLVAAKSTAGTNTSWYFVFSAKPNVVYALTRGGRGQKNISHVEKWEG